MARRCPLGLHFRWRDTVNRTSLIGVSNSDRHMSPNGMDSRNFIGGLATISLTATAAEGTRRPFYPEEVRDELGPNRRQMEAVNGQSKREVGKARWRRHDF